MKLPRILTHPAFVSISMQLILAYQWFHSGWGKIYGGTFVGSIHTSFIRFENGNPHNWYIDSVLKSAKEYPALFANLVQWGEILTGLGLLFALTLYWFSKKSINKNIARCIAISALTGGVFMNLNFYFAAGWTSPSTNGLNILMLWMQTVLLVSWIVIRTKDQKQ